MPGRMEELARLATERTVARGQPTAAVMFTSASSGLLVDFDADGQVVDSYTLPASTSAQEDGPSES